MPETEGVDIVEDISPRPVARISQPVLSFRPPYECEVRAPYEYTLSRPPYECEVRAPYEYTLSRPPHECEVVLHTSTPHSVLHTSAKYSAPYEYTPFRPPYECEVVLHTSTPCSALRTSAKYVLHTSTQSLAS